MKWPYLGSDGLLVWDMRKRILNTYSYTSDNVIGILKFRLTEHVTVCKMDAISIIQLIVDR